MITRPSPTSQRSRFGTRPTPSRLTKPISPRFSQASSKRGRRLSEETLALLRHLDICCDREATAELGSAMSTRSRRSIGAYDPAGGEPRRAAAVIRRTPKRALSFDSGGRAASPTTPPSAKRLQGQPVVSPVGRPDFGPSFDDDDDEIVASSSPGSYEEVGDPSDDSIMNGGAGLPSSGANAMSEEERASLALVEQLMREEEEALVERLVQAQAETLATMRSEATGEDREGLVAALRAAAAEAGDESFGDLDVDAMDYDELLELGERMGDVKTERWRLKSNAATSTLATCAYEELEEELKRANSLPCLVCRCDFEEDVTETVLVLPCKHFFHEDCARGWLKDHDTCLLCKKKVVQQQQQQQQQ